MASKKDKNKGGRPWFDGKDLRGVLPKLEEAAAMDATVAEACYYADISESAYYRYLKAHAKFRERIQRLRQRPVLRSRQNIINAIEDGDIGLSKWMMERKKADEFAEKIKVEHSDNQGPGQETDPRLAALRQEYHEKARELTKQFYREKKEGKGLDAPPPQ